MKRAIIITLSGIILLFQFSVNCQGQNSLDLEQLIQEALKAKS